jgi:hypothetical protein
MYDIEYSHNQEHEQSIKNIEEDFMSQKVAIVSRCVLNEPKYRPDQNEQVSRIEYMEMLAPGAV